MILDDMLKRELGRRKFINLLGQGTTYILLANTGVGCGDDNKDQDHGTNTPGTSPTSGASLSPDASPDQNPDGTDSPSPTSATTPTTPQETNTVPATEGPTATNTPDNRPSYERPIENIESLMPSDILYPFECGSGVEFDILPTSTNTTYNFRIAPDKIPEEGIPIIFPFKGGSYKVHAGNSDITQVIYHVGEYEDGEFIDSGKQVSIVFAKGQIDQNNFNRNPKAGDVIGYLNPNKLKIPSDPRLEGYNLQLGFVTNPAEGKMETPDFKGCPHNSN